MTDETLIQTPEEPKRRSLSEAILDIVDGKGFYLGDIASDQIRGLCRQAFEQMEYRSEQDQSDLTELRQFYTREGAMALIKKHWPDMIESTVIDAYRLANPQFNESHVSDEINQHEVADAFWQCWRENGETHKHGYYESTWMSIRAALRAALEPR